MTTNEPDQRGYIPPKTLIVPSRDLAFDAAFGWLRLGWIDFWNAPRISLTYGLFVFLVSVAVAWLAWKLGGFILLITALSGFVFVAPLLAFGLYSVSRQLCEGMQPNLAYTIRAIRRPLSNSMVFTLVLLVIFLLWARAGMMVQVFFPYGRDPNWTSSGLYFCQREFCHQRVLIANDCEPGCGCDYSCNIQCQCGIA